jgi:hypothetical protein
MNPDDLSQAGIGVIVALMVIRGATDLVKAILAAIEKKKNGGGDTKEVLRKDVDEVYKLVRDGDREVIKLLTRAVDQQEKLTDLLLEQQEVIAEEVKSHSGFLKEFRSHCVAMEGKPSRP